jgi:hypothetical protein
LCKRTIPTCRHQEFIGSARAADRERHQGEPRDDMHQVSYRRTPNSSPRKQVGMRTGLSLGLDAIGHSIDVMARRVLRRRRQRCRHGSRRSVVRSPILRGLVQISAGRLCVIFQGQEAPIVIYSMTTSTHADAPRGMEMASRI